MMPVRRLWALILSIGGVVCFVGFGLVFLKNMRRTWKMGDMPIFYGNSGKTQVHFLEDMPSFEHDHPFQGWICEPRVDSGLQVWDEAPGTLFVKNQSDKALYDLVIIHMEYDPLLKVYLGNAYETKLSVLAPGQTAKIYPLHYKAGVSRVVWARCE